ncbi:hypothetical protein L202_03753 [Cryptococcus amylolentus CBS 6039]|uniref:2-dehydropantoate 2-reductase n=1 Tax=Cryptococcus amylolentus CBS 6039 TaxID=1295533 RepID=A0A1E3HU23_9TREE|nr:hypothetical protein L202_03753 [Cryptococcus amylolentus CBS 6039]ODN79859.1 hypothetical protein L202_03753 [Cryptococcus amylolentus CBS 6039]
MSRARLHMLGLGSIGTLLSHHIRLSRPSLDMTLLVREPSRWANLCVSRDGIAATSESFDYESTSAPRRDAISSLVITLKTCQTSDAVAPLVSRLSRGSVISLFQNGMGVYDELCSRFWPDEGSRPHFVLGTTTHGASPHGSSKGEVLHHTPLGAGDIKWGVVPNQRYEGTPWDMSQGDSQSLHQRSICPSEPAFKNLEDTLQALLSVSDLNPSLLPYRSLHQSLLLKLAVNCAVNPLSAIVGRGSLTNSALMSIKPHGPKLLEMVNRETSRVLEALKELRGHTEETLHLFSYQNIREIVEGVIRATEGNTCSMAEDVRAKRPTEIDYINGYLAKLGDELGIDTPANDMLVDMVKMVEMSYTE